MTVKADWNDRLSHIAQSRWSIWGILLLASMLRGVVFLLHLGNGIQDADEAMIGLMARHIAEGSDFPLIWYGQQYMGTSTAWLTAGVFRLMGASGDAVRLVPLVFSICLPYISYRVAATMFGTSVGLLSALWIAISPPFLTILSLRYTCGNITLVLGALMLLLTYQIWQALETRQLPWKRVALLGMLMGFGLWVHLSSLAYILASAAFLGLRAWKKISFAMLLILSAGCVAGASPLWGDALLHQGQSLEFIVKIFQQPSQQAHAMFGTRLYNLLIVTLPAALSGTPMWSFHWLDFEWRLHPVVDDCVFLSLLMLVNALLCAVVIVLLIRKAITFTGSKWLQTGVILVSSVSLLLVAYSGVLFGRYLKEIQIVANMGLLQWRQFPNAPTLTPAFLVQECCSPAMLIYLAYLPALGYAVYISTRSGHRQQAAMQLLVLTLFATISSYVGTPYGEIRSPRYLIPLYSTLPVFLAVLVTVLARQRPVLSTGLMLGILTLHGIGIAQTPIAYYLQPTHYVNWWNPEQNQLVPSSNRLLIEFLQTHRITHVYAKYWLGMPIMFDSEETILASAGRTGRYPQYDDQVAQAERVAYIFHRNGFEWQRFEQLVHQAGIPYQRELISEYTVYSDVALPDRLNSPLWPAIVGLLQYP